MIRVNLIGGTKKAAGGGSKGFSIPMPTNVLPVVWVAILLGAVAYGWFWRSGLLAESETLQTQIDAATAQRAQLQSVIDENEIYETRLEILDNRVRTIEELQRNQVSPVLVLDMLSDAIGVVDYVWLSSLDQNDTTLQMNGTGTSQVAVADFITSLENTGYFTDINLGTITEIAGGLVSFNLACDFVPPVFTDDADDSGAGNGDETEAVDGAGAADGE